MDSNEEAILKEELRRHGETVIKKYFKMTDGLLGEYIENAVYHRFWLAKV